MLLLGKSANSIESTYKTEADSVFRKLDQRFYNYAQRLEYIYFLGEAFDDDQAKLKVEEIMEEINDMDSYETKTNRKVIQEIKLVHKQLRHS